jgi:hypothetical protein
MPGLYFPWDQRPFRELDASGDAYMPDDSGRFMHLARASRDNGYTALIPLKPYSKIPWITGWQHKGHTPLTDAELRRMLRWNNQLGFGYVACGQLVIFDIDETDEVAVQQRLNFLHEHVPGPAPMVRVGEFPRCHIVYASEDTSVGSNRSPQIFHGRINGKGHCVWFGYHPLTREPFKWFFGSPATRKWADLPSISGAAVNSFLAKFAGPLNDSHGSSGRGMGAVRAMLKFAQRNYLFVDCIADLPAVMAIAAPQDRHDIMKGCVSWATYYDVEPDEIFETLDPPYQRLFVGTRLASERVNDCRGMVKWARDNIKKRAGDRERSQ